jgi:serine/threonine protein kinase
MVTRTCTFQVFLAIETGTNRELAGMNTCCARASHGVSLVTLVKAVSKELVTRLKKISQVFREKDILARLSDSPYAVKLYCTFQDEKTLCKYIRSER